MPKRRKLNARKFLNDDRLLTLPRSAYDCSPIRYMKPVHGVPDPRGSLSASVPSRAIAKANKGVWEEVTRQAGKRGPYVKLSSSQRCEIAGQHGAVETARHFIFRWWAQATKIKCDENLTDEIFLRRKFPDKRGQRPHLLVIIMYTYMYVGTSTRGNTCTWI